METPLAIVAIGGLLVSTFLTMVYVPVLYSLFDDAGVAVGGWWTARHPSPGAVDPA